MPDPTRPFQIEADASKYASGAVLTQLDGNGDRHPVAYLSKSFSPTERNYEIYDRELLAIIRALQEWRHYIQGSGHTTTVYSDHKNLTYYRSAQNLNRRQARWSLYLSEFDLKLVHVAGTKMIQADALSRRSDLCPNEDNDNLDVTMLPDNLFVNLIDLDLQERIASSDIMDNDAAEALRLLLETGPSTLRSDLGDWTTSDFMGKPILFYKGKNYIPQNQELRRHLLQKYHDHPTAGHPGEIETYNGISEHYWWPGMRTFVKNYVKGCADCQQFKINRQPAKPSYSPIPGPTSTRPFANCSMDLITDLPPVNGYDCILSVVDHGLTKGVILIPCTKTSTSEDIAKLLIDNLYKRFGLPDKMISDRDPRFCSRTMEEFFKILGIEHAKTTAFHPQSDGTTERFNQEIEAYLSIYCCQHPEQWLMALPLLEFTHNNRRHSDRQKTPFQLITGINPVAIPMSFENTKYPNLEERMKQLQNDRQEALAAHELARHRMENRIKSNFEPFKIGQKVWLDARNLKTCYNKKMAPRREGPFIIKQVLGPLTYRLQLPETWKIHNVFHAYLLSPYRENEIHGENYPRPTADIIDGDEEYEVESILGHQRRGRGYRYKIKWKGYPISEASWEPTTNLQNATDILEAYKLLHQL
jgi:RNase H-like domain found in reverse transcriptase/Integrase zinc binding domain/Chromo (CHRromatin Organisation MOdifier) domain